MVFSLIGQPRPAFYFPGSGSRQKCWPAEKFAELSRRLTDSGHRVRLLLGEVEQEQWGQEHAKAFDPRVKVLTPHSYLELLEQFVSARCVVANDSGPGHLSGVLGVPTLSLFGPTDPAVWRPLGPRVQALRHEPLDQLPVDQVADALACLIAPSASSSAG